MKLYIYDHCPYCVKARMLFGLRQMPVALVTLQNDDEATPVRMIGQKMVPILQTQDGRYMPESMDIVRYVDQQVGGKPVLSSQTTDELGQWLLQTREYLYKLAMPRWVQSPLEEFATQGARDYFTHKKEAMIGRFADALAESAALIAKAEEHMQALEPMIQSERAVHGVLSEDDIHLFAVLRSLSIVKGVCYPAGVEAYRRQMSELSAVPLHDALAR